MSSAYTHYCSRAGEGDKCVVNNGPRRGNYCCPACLLACILTFFYDNSARTRNGLVVVAAPRRVVLLPAVKKNPYGTATATTVVKQRVHLGKTPKNYA